MAIQPIDLQTLYTQLEKVGKTQVHQAAAAQAARDAEMVKNREEAEKHLKTVREVEAGGDQVGVVHDKNESNAGSPSGTPSKGGKDSSTPQKEEPPKEIIRDPNLGSIIDISG